MPKELIETSNFETSIKRYRQEIGVERYQHLTSLLNTLKNLCQSSMLQESGQSQLPSILTV